MCKLENLGLTSSTHLKARYSGVHLSSLRPTNKEVNAISKCDSPMDQGPLGNSLQNEAAGGAVFFVSLLPGLGCSVTSYLKLLGTCPHHLMDCTLSKWVKCKPCWKLFLIRFFPEQYRQVSNMGNLKKCKTKRNQTTSLSVSCLSVCFHAICQCKSHWHWIKIEVKV